MLVPMRVTKESVAHNKTTVVIAHRLSTVVDAHDLQVVCRRKIDPSAELLLTHRYSSLTRMQ